MATFNTIYKLSTVKLNERFEQHFGFAPPANMSRNTRAEAIYQFEQTGESPQWSAKDLGQHDDDRSDKVIEVEIAGLPVTIEIEPEPEPDSNRRNEGAVLKMMGITSADYHFVRNNFDKTLVEYVCDQVFLNITNNVVLGEYQADEIISLWLDTVADFRIRFAQLNDAVQKDSTNTHNHRRAMSICNRWLPKRTDRAVRSYITKVRKAIAELNL